MRQIGRSQTSAVDPHEPSPVSLQAPRPSGSSDRYADYDSLDESDGESDIMLKPVIKQEPTLTPSSTVPDEGPSVSPPTASQPQSTRLVDFLATLKGVDRSLADVLAASGVEDSSDTLLELYRDDLLSALLEALEAQSKVTTLQRVVLLKRLEHL